MLEHETELNDLYHRFAAKDYWGDEELIAMRKQERDLAIERLMVQYSEIPAAYQFPTDEEIEDYYHGKSLSFVHQSYARINQAVREKDSKWLHDVVRYDQIMMLELYELVTGQRVKGLSNKKLAQVFDAL